MQFTSLAVATLVAAVQAVDVQVVFVGQNPANNATGNQFWPDTIRAEPGSMVQFQFWTGNHTVTQSSFDQPCVPLENATPAAGNGTQGEPVPGIKSGFQPADASLGESQVPVYTIMINDTSPMWFYCGQGQHCQAGMALVINPNEDDEEKTLEEYKNRAAAVAGDDDSDSPGGADGSDGTDGGAGSGSGDGSDGPGGEGGENGSIPGSDDEGTTDGAGAGAANGLAAPGLMVLLAAAGLALF